MNDSHGYSGSQWQLLHDAIRMRLRAACAEVQAAISGVTVVPGQTVTELFPLYSYVRIHGINCEDTLMGVQFVPVGSQWRIDADVAAEASGEVYFELPNTPFTVSSFEDLRDRVLAITNELVAGGTPVLLRLFGSPATVVPSQTSSLHDVAHKG